MSEKHAVPDGQPWEVAICYSRAAKSAPKGQTVQDQDRRNAEWVEREIGNVPVLVFSDQGATPKGGYGPNLLAAMEEIAKHPRGVFVAQDGSRISRSVYALVWVLDTCREHGWRFVLWGSDVDVQPEANG